MCIAHYLANAGHKFSPSDLVCADGPYSSMSSTNLHSPLVRPGGLSEKSRSLSANTLKDRLSKLTTPLNVVNPVAALHANIKCVFFIACYHLSYQIESFSFVISFQFCPGTNSEETEVADACSRRMVCDDSYNNVCMAPVMVCLPLYTALFSTLLRIKPFLCAKLTCCGYFYDDIATDDIV